MTKQATNTGRVGVAPSSDLIRCAGCGVELPDTAGDVRQAWPDPLALELRCDLCWRSMLAAEAAQWRQEQAKE